MASPSFRTSNVDNSYQWRDNDFDEVKYEKETVDLWSLGLPLRSLPTLDPIRDSAVEGFRVAAVLSAQGFQARSPCSKKEGSLQKRELSAQFPFPSVGAKVSFVPVSGPCGLALLKRNMEYGGRLVLS